MGAMTRLARPSRPSLTVIEPTFERKARRAISTAIGALRVALTLAALLALASLRSAHAAEEEVGARLSRFGEALSELEGLHPHSAPRRLVMNGMELGVLGMSTELELDEALERLESTCGRGGLDVPGALLHEPGNAPGGGALGRLSRGVLRQRSGDRGVLACLDTGERLARTTLAERLGRLAKTGDLGAVGALRFAFLSRTGRTTTVLFIWSTGSLPILAAFPKTGDAPGRDLDGIPRPEGSRRLLSAAEAGSPYALGLYEDAAASPNPLATYAALLGARGFTVTRVSGERLWARLGTRELVVRVTRHGSKALYSLALLG